MSIKYRGVSKWFPGFVFGLDLLNFSLNPVEYFQSQIQSIKHSYCNEFVFEKGSDESLFHGFDEYKK